MSRLTRTVLSLSRSYHVTRPSTPLSLPHGCPSLLPLVLSSSNLLLHAPIHNADQYSVSTRTEDGCSTNQEVVVPFHLSRHDNLDAQKPPIGFVRTPVSEAFAKDHQRQIKQSSTSPWDIQYSPNGQVTSISFAPWVNQGGRHLRTSHIGRLVCEWKEKAIFDDILRGWSDEGYPVYDHTGPLSQGNPVVFAIERAALPLFGFANYGTLLVAYFNSHTTNKTMIWVPRRSMTKRTWPGKLDVTVGGGIGLGDTALATIIRECSEEASLDADFIRKNVRPVGMLPFPNRSPAGWILPGLYYLYDLPLKPDENIVPLTNATDGEVESFELMDAETVLQNLVEGRFKPSSALAMVDFFIRHGLITETTDSRYADVCRFLKRDVNLPVP